MSERSLETIIGIVGILKAGGAYLPMDADYPKERIDYMLKDSGAKILLTGLPEGHKLHHSSNQFIIHHSSNLAYIIYTSGSTGKPKGVMVEHGNVVSLILNKRFSIAFGPGDVWILFHSLCFDFSVWELFGALVYGGKLVVVSGGTARTPRALAELLEQEKVTVLNQVPTAFASLAAEVLRPGKKRKLYLRYIIFGGEALRPPQLAAWYDKYPGVRLVNMYGITETTVHSTYKEIGRQEIEAGISNIGSALPGWQCYIVDHKLRPVPMGTAGEILIAGAGTARGYLNNPELTAEKFNHDKENYQTFCGGPGGSFSKEPPGRRRLYKSGDLGR
jgi:amino acid adenylation domain-containing protein